jgi:hypothetical protein
MRTASLATVLVALTACGSKSDTADTAAAFDAETQALVDELHAASAGYDSWSQSANYPGVTATPGGVHGESVQIWWNTEAYETVAAAAGGDMPEGALIVKEGYSDDAGATLNTVTYMWKKDGDWFWMRDTSGGATTTAGYGIADCADCHAAGQDSVRAETW